MPDHKTPQWLLHLGHEDYGIQRHEQPLKRDVVREYVDAFRKKGLDVMLYYSILDTHHRLRPGFINRNHIDLIKNQLKELLTNYGPISASSSMVGTLLGRAFHTKKSRSTTSITSSNSSSRTASSWT